MNLLNNLKFELNITDNTQNLKLEYLIEKAKREIDIYLRLNTDFSDMFVDEDFEKKYHYALIEFTKYKYINSNFKPIDGNIKSYTEGKRSITYKDNTSLSDSIPLEVRRLLPLPSLRMW